MHVWVAHRIKDLRALSAEEVRMVVPSGDLMIYINAVSMYATQLSASDVIDSPTIEHS